MGIGSLPGEQKRVTASATTGVEGNRSVRSPGKGEKPHHATLNRWRSYVTSFVQLAAPDDALSIRRPHVIRWKQHLVDLGDSPRQSGTASGDREGRRVWVVDKEPRVTP